MTFVRDKVPNFRLNPDLLKDLLLMCTENVQFTFNNEFYRQSDGIMMGSYLGPILSNIFMAKLEMEHKHIIDSLDFYVRYVDDILIFVRNIQFSIHGMEILNSLLNMKIMVYLNDIPFLDVMLARRQDGTLMRSVYRKPTWLPLYIHYHSYAPMKYKVGLIKTLFHRANRLCTDDMVVREREQIVKHLKANLYPEWLIRRHNTSERKDDQKEVVERKSIWMRLPYKGS